MRYPRVAHEVRTAGLPINQKMQSALIYGQRASGTFCPEIKKLIPK